MSSVQKYNNFMFWFIPWLNKWFEKLVFVLHLDLINDKKNYFQIINSIFLLIGSIFYFILLDLTSIRQSKQIFCLILTSAALRSAFSERKIVIKIMSSIGLKEEINLFSPMWTKGFELIEITAVKGEKKLDQPMIWGPV